MCLSKHLLPGGEGIAADGGGAAAALGGAVPLRARQSEGEWLTRLLHGNGQLTDLSGGGARQRWHPLASFNEVPAQPLSRCAQGHSRRQCPWEDATALGLCRAGGRRAAGREAASSFLSAQDATAATGLAPFKQRGSGHADFLFGGSDATQGQALAPGISPPTKLKLVPKLSMLAGGSAAAAASAARMLQKLDPLRDEDEDEEAQTQTGFNKFVPRGLRFFYFADLASLLVLAASAFNSCDVPLKTWLAGGLLFGYPATWIVNRLASKKPRFEWYRLMVREVRNGGDPRTFKLSDMIFYDQFMTEIDRGFLQQHQDEREPIWFIHLRRNGPELIRGYQFVTHGTAGPGTDPTSWTLEGSVDGVTWEVIDDCEGVDLPLERGELSDIIEEMLHEEQSKSVFRGAFLLEVLMNAAAFAWLVAGTAWVSLGTETCVDYAPTLWYFSFLVVVLVWSLIGTVTVGLIISAVAMIVIGARAPSGP